MAKSENPEEKQANKDIAAVIYYFYTKQKIKPDATHFKSGYNMLKPLMFPSEQYAVYTLEEIKRAIDYLLENNIVLLSLSILSWPNLVSSIARKDERALKILTKNIKDAQMRDGIIFDESVPKGW